MANVPAAFITAQAGKVMAVHGLSMLAATDLSIRMQTTNNTDDSMSSMASSGFSAFSAFSETPFVSSR